MIGTITYIHKVTGITMQRRVVSGFDKPAHTLTLVVQLRDGSTTEITLFADKADDLKLEIKQ